MSDEKSRFTARDQENIEKLPAAEVLVFGKRLAEITIRHQINEDTWDSTNEKIREEADALFTEIKTRLKIFEERGQ